MKNGVIRSLTGLIYVLVIVGGILNGAYAFGALFALVTICCLWEFYGLLNTHKNLSINRLHHCLGGLILFATTFVIASERWQSTMIFVPLLIYLVSVLVAELYAKNSDQMTHLGAIFLGQIYIALPLSLLNYVAFSRDGYIPTFLLALFVFIWLNDTGAYIIGILFGKHHLIERISPKKSWEGFWGGLFFAGLSSLAFAYYVPAIHWYIWLALALLVALFGVWGDLVESLIKRNLGIKDSGNALPGHGGFLDRFDSLLLAVYAVVFYCCCHV
ncbi:phosphatidate cytidylyltransferase [Bacteroidia bacterium]|nr:phosphatidate cytidylyltransferase [Bacteroidia bacterium]